MDKIVEKIAKLLELASNNPSENEAIAAAMKAQELMAKYDIEMDQIHHKQGEVTGEIYRDTGKHQMKKWKVGLAHIIAKNFRCRTCMINSVDVVFYGYNADAKIALQVFTYLYEAGNNLAVRYYNKARKEGRSTKGVMNTYLVGFKDGVASALEKQCMALMIVTPQEVNDTFNEMTADFKKKAINIKYRKDSEAYETGKSDGKNAVQAKALEAA